MHSACNSSATFVSTTVEGTLSAVDSNQEFVQMSGLNTPMYRYDESLVRVSDIRYLVAKPVATVKSLEPKAP